MVLLLRSSRCTVVGVVVFTFCSSPFALHRAALVRGPGQVVPPEDNLYWPPAVAALFGESKDPEGG